WDRTYLYAEDEPISSDYPAIALQSGWLNESDPDWKARIFDTTIPDPASSAILDPQMGMWVICLKCYDNWNNPTSTVFGRDAWAARLLQGIHFWFYESNAQGPPYPGLASNTLDAAEPRIMMWGSWFEGATGFLYYDVNSWDESN